MLDAGTTEKVVAVMLGKAFRFAQIHFVAALLPQADAHNLQLILAQDHLVAVKHFPDPEPQPEKIEPHTHRTDNAGTVKTEPLIRPAATDGQQRHISQPHLTAAPGGRLPADFLILQKTPSNTRERFSETH